MVLQHSVILDVTLPALSDSTDGSLRSVWHSLVTNDILVGLQLGAALRSSDRLLLLCLQILQKSIQTNQQSIDCHDFGSDQKEKTYHPTIDPTVGYNSSSTEILGPLLGFTAVRQLERHFINHFGRFLACGL